MDGFTYPDWCRTCDAFTQHVARTAAANSAPIFPIRCTACGRVDEGRITPA